MSEKTFFCNWKPWRRTTFFSPSPLARKILHLSLLVLGKSARVRASQLNHIGKQPLFIFLTSLETRSTFFKHLGHKVKSRFSKTRCLLLAATTKRAVTDRNNGLFRVRKGSMSCLHLQRTKYTQLAPLKILCKLQKSDLQTLLRYSNLSLIHI